MRNKTKIEEIFIKGIPLPETKPVQAKPKTVLQKLRQIQQKLNQSQQSADTAICLHFLSQLRFLTFGLLILIFIRTVQILEIVRSTNFCG